MHLPTNLKVLRLKRWIAEHHLFAEAVSERRAAYTKRSEGPSAPPNSHSCLEADFVRLKVDVGEPKPFEGFLLLEQQADGFLAA